MHTRKRHQDMFQDLNRKIHSADKDRESPPVDAKAAKRWSVSSASSDKTNMSVKTLFCSAPPLPPLYLMLFSFPPIINTKHHASVELTVWLESAAVSKISFLIFVQCKCQRSHKWWGLQGAEMWVGKQTASTQETRQESHNTHIW